MNETPDNPTPDLTDQIRQASRGDTDAQCNLGHRYRLGDGVNKNLKESLRWFRRAAEQGHVYAQYHLGRAYAWGEGVGENLEQALRWFRSAAQQGHAGAQYEIGCAYRYGDGVPKDPVEAAHWLRKSARSGDPFALDIIFDAEVKANQKGAIEQHAKAKEDDHKSKITVPTADPKPQQLSLER